MSDSYQAIYDAVRSRISGGNLGDVAERIMRDSFDISRYMSTVSQDFSAASFEMQRPSVLFRPILSKDGDSWCALYGNNLQEGFAAFGETPDKAMRAFDAAWCKP